MRTTLSLPVCTQHAAYLPFTAPVTTHIPDGDEHEATRAILHTLASQCTLPPDGAPGGVEIFVNVDTSADLDAEEFTLSIAPSYTRARRRLSITAHASTARGAYYAALTLQALIRPDNHGSFSVPEVTFRDKPSMSIRGSIEGFYGVPWSHQARLDHIRFLGQHRMNTYIYSPKDDPYLRSRWRELYPSHRLEEITELARQAHYHHVDLVLALSPGNDITYSDPGEIAAVAAKYEQLRRCGIRQFYIALDDIEPRLQQEADLRRFTDADPWVALAQAQAFFLNNIDDHVISPAGLPDLWTVPTMYTGDNEHPYKRTLGEELHPHVRVQWTGNDVFSPHITEESARRAAQAYRREKLIIWDNFPVNDDKKDRVFFTALQGREAGISRYVDGITANPMVQPYASMPALAELGSFTWNPSSYVPQACHEAALDDIAGAHEVARQALAIFNDLNQSWPYRSEDSHAPTLSELAKNYTHALEQAAEAGNRTPWALQSVDERLSHLLAYLDRICALPADLQDLNEPSFFDDIRPWVLAAANWARAAREASLLRYDLQHGAAEEAMAHLEQMRIECQLASTPRIRHILGDYTVVDNDIVPSVGDGVFNTIVDEAAQAWQCWSGLEPLLPGPLVPLATITTDLGSRDDYPLSNIATSDMTSLWWSQRGIEEGSHVIADFGKVVDISHIRLLQGRSNDNHWHKFYHPVLELSVNGSQWMPVARSAWVGCLSVTLPAGTVARYLRLRAERANPAGISAQVRLIEVRGMPRGCTTSAISHNGSSHLMACDASAWTLWQAEGTPGNDELVLTLDQAIGPGAGVLVAGHIDATVRVRDVSGQWHDLTRTQPDRLITCVYLPDGMTVNTVSLARIRGHVNLTAFGVRSLLESAH